MQFKGIKVWLILVTCLISLGLLIGGNYYYKKIKVDKPLAELYNGNSAVEKFEIKEESKDIKILLTLDKTQNLKKTYQDLQEGTATILGSKPFVLTVKDNRTEELREVFDNNQLVIYEALTKGNFIEMENVFIKRAEEKGAKARVSMDKQKMYIQLSKGEHYLYEVIEWQSNLTAGGIGSDKNDQRN